jgi:hypothetical protein
MLMVFEIAPDKRLGRRHHADVRFPRQEPLAELAALVRTIEDGVVLRLQVRGTFNGHGAADVRARFLDLTSVEAEVGEQIEAGARQQRVGNLERVLEELVAERPAIENEAEFKRSGQLIFDLE